MGQSKLRLTGGPPPSYGLARPSSLQGALNFAPLCRGHPGQVRGPGLPDVARGDAPTLAREASRRMTSKRNRCPRPGAISIELVRQNGSLCPPLSDILPRTSCAVRAGRTGGRAPGLTACKSGISVYRMRPPLPVFPASQSGQNWVAATYVAICLRRSENARGTDRDDGPTARTEFRGLLCI